jgi:hypothetical protein
MKPHYRLHFAMFDGKTPLWWVAKFTAGPVRGPWIRSTNGYARSDEAVRAAARL